MPIYNFFVPKEFSQLADKKELASVLAAKTLVIILERKAQSILRRFPDAIIQIEGSCIEDLSLFTEGLDKEELDILCAYSGLSPKSFQSASERTA
jgi:hypothetical protein